MTRGRMANCLAAQGRTAALLVGVAMLTLSRFAVAQGRAGINAVDMPVTVTLRKRFAVGGAEDTRFTPQFLFARSVTTDNSGRLYVLDASQQKVIVFNARGDMVATRGRSGAGPGEFTGAGAIAIGDDGSLAVSDNSKRALVRFDSTGRVMPETSTREFRFVQQILSVRTTAGRSAMMLSVTARDTDLVVRRSDNSSARLLAVPPVAEKLVPAWNACGLSGQSSVPLLTPRLLAAGHGSDVSVNADGSFTVLVFSGDQSPKVLTRSTPAAKATVADARRILGDSQVVYMGKRACYVPTATVAQQAGVASTVPAYRALAVDHLHRTWAIRTTAARTATLVDLYDATRGYLGTATIGRANPVAFLSDGAMVSLERDDDDAPVLVVYDFTVRR